MKTVIMQNAVESGTFNAYEVVDRVVKRRGNTGGIYLPKAWLGKRVKVLLIEPLGPER